MFIRENNNTQSYPCQYANVFACSNTNSYIRGMDKMREILKELMSRSGDDAYSLEGKSKVPQPTTQRFLSGKHGDPRSSTVRKWAAAYGITESQLRGDVPIDGIADRQADTVKPPELIGEAPDEEKQLLEAIRKLDSETKTALLKITSLLPAGDKKIGGRRLGGERRQRENTVKEERRQNQLTNKGGR